MCVLLSFSGCIEANALIRDAETRISIANILSNYELLLEHGYEITRDTGDEIFLNKRASSEDGFFTHRIEINRRYLSIADTDISFRVSAYTRRFTYYADPYGRNTSNQWFEGATRRISYTHRLRVENDSVVINLLEDTSNRDSINLLFDELNLIFDIVNLVSANSTAMD